MAVVFMDGCDTNDITKWTSWANTSGGGSYQPTGSRFSTQCIQLTNLRKYVPASTTDYILLGCWIKLNLMPNGSVTKNAVMAYNGGETESAILIRAEDDGRLSVGKWGGTTVAATSTDVWADGTWHWIDLYVLFDGAAGFVHLWVDGYEQINSTGLNMITSGTPVVSNIHFVGGGLAPISVDDVVWYDNTTPGLSSADYPLTPMRIDTQRPSANVSVQFTPSSGTNWSNINKSTFAATPYNEDAVAGEADLFDYTDMVLTPTTIKTVVVTTVMQNSGTGAISAQARVKSSGTTVEGPTTENLTAPFVNYQQEYYHNPNGNIPWVKATLDAAQFGYRVSP